LVACCVKGNQIPDTSTNLETETNAEQDVEGLHKFIFPENGAQETVAQSKRLMTKHDKIYPPKEAHESNGAVD
jgi:hypothetical protein